MLFERIESKGLAHYSYLIGDSGEAIVIDPRRDGDVYIDKATAEGLRITHILETHRNEDYVIGSVELAARTGATIWHADKQWAYAYGEPVEEGQTWALGKFKLSALHTPGHTPGMMNYVWHDPSGVPWIVFTGDTLFAGDVGRVDLLGEEKLEENAGLLYDSILGKLLPLGDGVIVCPAHGSGSACGSSIADRPWTTIGLERKLNPRLQHTERDEFIAQVAHKQERPPYFHQMEVLNLQGPPILGPLPTVPPLSVEAFEREARSAMILDIRAVLNFNAGHIPGALSIWLDDVPRYAGWFLPYDRPLLLVNETDDPTPVTRYLIRLGYDRLAGYLAGGMSSWHTAGRESESIATVGAPEMCALRAAGNRSRILDVRRSAELEEDGEIEGAQHIHITQLPEHLGEVPKEEPVYTICASGKRATIAASILQREGWPEVAVVLGGFEGWKAAGCPVKE